MGMERLLNVEEVAERLGVKQSTIRRRILRKEDRLRKDWACRSDT